MLSVHAEARRVHVHVYKRTHLLVFLKGWCWIEGQMLSVPFPKCMGYSAALLLSSPLFFYIGQTDSHSGWWGCCQDISQAEKPSELQVFQHPWEPFHQACSPFNHLARSWWLRAVPLWLEQPGLAVNLTEDKQLSSKAISPPTWQRHTS